MADKAIEVLLDEKRNFPPPKEFKKSANIKSAAVFNTARKNPQAFWAKAAKDLHWFKPWKKVLEWNSPWAKWFIGGKLNASYNCLDRHVQGRRKNKAAIIWEGEPGDERVLTYRDVWREVNKFANVLKKLGVKKGDRVCHLHGHDSRAARSPCSPATASARRTVWSSAASAPKRLRDRINDAQAKVLVTADGGWRRGSVVPLKTNADEALTDAPSIEHVVVVKRIGADSGAQMKDGRDLWWHELMAEAPLWCAPRADGQRRHALHPLHQRHHRQTQGHPAHHRRLSHRRHARDIKWVFDMKEDDVFWCTADIGWVTGHTLHRLRPAWPTARRT